MNTSPRSPKPREIDHVLVRMPASVHEMAASAAQNDHISKNSFFATAVLEVALAHRIHTLGCPENVKALLCALDAACTEDFPAMGAFQRADWDDIVPIVAALSDVGVLSDVRAKPDPKDANLIVYAFTLSKLGRAIWPRFAERIQAALAHSTEGMQLPLVYNAVR